VVREFGHNRWRFENQGFNELVTRWHSPHVFHHHGNWIAALARQHAMPVRSRDRHFDFIPDIQLPDW
jgi:predicted nucleic acid-binding protein